jgi:cytochrome c biogenesis protein CcmG, thiol:disulfide interchange protein DsbE
VKKFIVPLAVFAVLGILLWVGLSLNPRKIPSPLIGKPLPTFSLPSLHEPKRIVTPDSLRGRVYLLNVWASWCVACRQEHPVLKAIASQKIVPLIGLNYKDQREDALAWLKQFEDPYQLSIVDLEGRLGIELGVYGVPETFVIDKAGVIRYKFIGPVTDEAWNNTLLPLVRQLSS